MFRIIFENLTKIGNYIYSTTQEYFWELFTTFSVMGYAGILYLLPVKLIGSYFFFTLQAAIIFLQCFCMLFGFDVATTWTIICKLYYLSTGLFFEPSAFPVDINIEQKEQYIVQYTRDENNPEKYSASTGFFYLQGVLVLVNIIFFLAPFVNKRLFLLLFFMRSHP